MRSLPFALAALLLTVSGFRLVADELDAEEFIDDSLPTFVLAPEIPEMESRGTEPPVPSTDDAPTTDEVVVADPDAPAKADPAKAAKAAAAAKKKKEDLKKAVATAYAGVFYNNNFAYINNPLYDDWYPGEALKQNRIGECWIYDFGGQFRMRHHSERNMRNGPGFAGGLTGNDDDFLLYRTRLFLNLKRADSFRVYAEYLDAQSNYENFAPRAIEENRSDFLNLFGDLRLADLDGGDLWLRVGRQELLYGAQRLISPLDWANTRRNFEGLNVFWKGDDWNFDAFATHPVVVDPYRFDTADYGQDFMGAYANYKGRKNEQIDLYYLHYMNNRIPAAVAPNGIYYETAGARWQGSKDEWLWDTEGAYQFGSNGDNSGHSAAFLVGGVGRKFDHDWKPTLWGYLDWSSGGNQLGKRQGFDHLFPLGHRYHGFMDFYARSNITTPNILLETQPHERLKCLLWYHYFFLSNPNDTPYNVNMSPYNPGNRPVSRDLGHEIDFLATFIINPRMDLQFGYSHFFSGQYYKLTPGVPFRGDADFFYTHAQWNF